MGKDLHKVFKNRSIKTILTKSNSNNIANIETRNRLEKNNNSIIDHYKRNPVNQNIIW